MTAPPDWRAGRAPGHERSSGGALSVGGVSAGELARVYGTPLTVIDMDVLDAAIDAFRAACDPLGVEVSYAAKALSCVGLFRHIAARGVGIDVCSLGELLTAQRAGVPAAALTLHGAGKTGEELDAAASGQVARIVVDGIDELNALASHLERCPRTEPLDVVLRLNAGIDAATHAYVRTGGDDSKFGLHRRDEAAAAAVVRCHERMRFAGLHAHAGSQIATAKTFAAIAAALAEAAERFEALGLRAETLIAGGGFAVCMIPSGQAAALDLPATIAAAHAAARGRRLGIEPGRALIAHAGTTLYRVMAVKRQTDRTFVIVDGSMADNPRPALYDAYHHIIPADRDGPAEIEATVCGRSCENDELGAVSLPSDVRSGDLLAMCTTGAYTYSMAGNYNRFPRPAVVAVRAGAHEPLVARETVEDVLARDCNA
jgi:diaminopimelate decarboxylase